MLEAMKNHTFIDTILSWIRRIIAKFQKADSDVEKQIRIELIKIQDAIEKMYKQSQKQGFADDEVKYSIADTQNMSWEKQINAVLRNKKSIKHSDTLVLENNTPDLLVKNGIDDLPLAIPLSIITKARSGKDVSHSISDINLVNLKNAIENPIAIVVDEARNAILFVTNLKENNGNIVVTFEKNAVFDSDKVHKATSIHSRKDMSAYFESINNAHIYCENENKLTAVSGSSINLERLKQNNKFIDINIPHNSKVVNSSISENAENETENIKYSLDVDSNKKITVDMSDSDRAAILKNSNIDICNVSNTSVVGIDFDYLESNIKSVVEKDLLKKLNELGFLKKYRSSAIDVQFELTGKGIRKSLNSQENSYGGSKADFAKAILNIEKLLDNALLIETHTDKGKGTQRENRRLKQVYVLMSAMQDGRYIIPVQFEVKQYVDDNNRLYLAVALTKIETGVMVHTAFETQMRTGLLPISNISILELFAKINPKDKNFLKYVPDEFLNAEQLNGKELALEIDKKKYAKVSDNEKYSLDIDTSKMTASEFVKSLGEKYHAQFDALDIAYNKKNRVTAAQFASKEAIANTPHSPLFNNNISQKVKLSIVVYPKNHKLKQG